jgi:transcription-repair coupling factor (superfamily II helicase)
LDSAESIARELRGYLGRDVSVLPPKNAAGLGGQDMETAGSRGKALAALAAGGRFIVVTTAAAAAEPWPAPTDASALALRLSPGEDYDLDTLVEQLAALGFERAYQVSDRGEFSVRGGIVDIFGPGMPHPARLEFDGDMIAEIREFDLAGQISSGPAGTVYVFAVKEPDSHEDAAGLSAYAGAGAIVIADEPDAFPADSLSSVFLKDCVSLTGLSQEAGLFDAAAHPVFLKADNSADFDKISGHLNDLARDGYRIVFAVEGKGRMARFGELVMEWGLPAEAVTVLDAPFERGFILPGLKTALVTEQDLFRRRNRLRQTRQTKAGAFFDVLDIKPGDYVVHAYHGIARYGGLTAKDVDGFRREYLLLEYAEGDKLYIPTDQIGFIQRYIAGGEGKPAVDRLGSRRWQTAKRRAKASTAKMAAELVALYTARKAARGYAFAADTPWQKELEDSFPFNETPDQAEAIRAVKTDMEAEFPMDRLICGDVGYGKTEVAIRAVFKAVMDGKQAAVLAPTTLLAEQHFTTFRERFEEFPIKVALLSRLRAKNVQAETVAGLAAGSVDVVIGTHRLLQKDIEFNDLGLFVIDEEQRFGVRHKEFLKKLRLNVDVMTLSATPIPRTLNMALTGARDMSVINTPPEDRFPVVTSVEPYDEDRAAAALSRELDRGGQAFFVHNRVESIEFVAARLRRVIPGARIAVSHGQMSEHELERVMRDFAVRQTDILVSTTIIESGLDMPNVNTLVVDRADKLGLSQLYQLRGRVGRSDRRAYAYFLYPPDRPLSTTQTRRLKTIAEFTELGSGFRIALRDLEIRGAGDVLGAEQHGFIADIGFEMYAELLSEAVAKEKGEARRARPDVRINLPITAYLPESYIENEAARVDAYKRIASALSPEDADRILDGLKDRFGPPPDAVKNLLGVAALKALAADAGIRKINAERDRVRLSPVDPESAARAAAPRDSAVKLLYKPAERALYVSGQGKSSPVLLLHKILCDILD